MSEFEILLPPTWVLISLNGRVEEQVSAFVSYQVEKAPVARRHDVRVALATPLVRVADELASGGALALAISTEPVDGLVGSPIAVFMPFTVPTGQQPLDLLLALAAEDPTAVAFGVGEYVGVRTSSVSDATASVHGALEQAAAMAKGSLSAPVSAATAERHVTRYFIGDPGDPAHWVDVSFSVTSTSLPGSSALAEASSNLFEAAIQTFRWVA